MAYKTKRARATDISPRVRKIVHERDRYRCIFCGSTYRIELAHIISRSKGGLGIEQNLVCACQKCHRNMDSESEFGKELRKRAKHYLEFIYGEIDESEMKYKHD